MKSLESLWNFVPPKFHGLYNLPLLFVLTCVGFGELPAQNTKPSTDPYTNSSLRTNKPPIEIRELSDFPKIDGFTDPKYMTDTLPFLIQELEGLIQETSGKVSHLYAFLEKNDSDSLLLAVSKHNYKNALNRMTQYSKLQQRYTYFLELAKNQSGYNRDKIYDLKETPDTCVFSITRYANLNYLEDMLPFFYKIFANKMGLVLDKNKDQAKIDTILDWMKENKIPFQGFLGISMSRDGTIRVHYSTDGFDEHTQSFTFTSSSGK